MFKKRKQRWEKAVLKFWYSKSLFAYFLIPLSWVFTAISLFRFYWLVYIKKPATFNTPIIVVGNISLGGTGKTPLVEWLVKFLMQQGYSPGIVMRGFKGTLQSHEITSVTPTSDVALVGDESILLATKCQCPVVIGRKRKGAVKYLLSQFPMVNIIISDDGLQHYALARDIEIAVMDGERRLGNGFCLPAGPLREPPSRLRHVDFVVLKGKARENEWSMNVKLDHHIFQIKAPHTKYTLKELMGKKVHAIAGIGHPERFFSMLRDNEIHPITHYFSDHHQYSEKDFLFEEDIPIVMTEKDAVKCQHLVPHAWVIPLNMHLPTEFGQLILQRIQNGQKTTRNSRLSNLQTASTVCKGK